MSELRERVQNEVYDIIGISETWANDFINDAEMDTVCKEKTEKDARVVD